MKKNFFKKLSFVMALAMIISVIAPAAGAFAATSPSLNATKKYLHLSGITGANEYDFNVANKQSGWKYAWTTSNADVVTVNSVGLTTAVSVGSAKVTVDITDKKGADVATLSADVVVRDNISSITEIYYQGGTQDLKALKVGTDYDFGRKFTTEAGSTTKTSAITRWVVSSAKASITDAGVFKATEAGDYTITALAFQSVEKYNAWKALNDVKSTTNVLASKTLDVKVVASITGVTQVDIDTFKVSFDTAMTDVAKNISAFQVLGGTNVSTAIIVKEVKMAADNKSAEVTVFVPFTAKATYIVKYTGMADNQFVAATTEVKDVKSMQVLTTSAEVQTEKTLEVALLNAAGVNIATTELLARVEWASANNGTYLYGNKLSMFKVGDTTTVTAKFHTYEYDTTTGAEVGVLTASGVVTCTNKSAAAYGTLNAYTVVSGSPNFNDVKHSVAADDMFLTLYVQLKGKEANGWQDKYTDNDNTPAGAAFRFTSSDPSVLIVDPVSGVVYPAKEGSATVVVEFNPEVANTSSPYTVVGSCSIVVTGARKLATISQNATTFTLSNDTQVQDVKTVELTLKDQLGSDYNNYAVTTTVNGHNGVDGGLLVSGNTKNISFNAAPGGASVAEGTYTYTVKVKDLSNNAEFVRVINVIVKAPAPGPVYYYALETNKSSYDTTIQTWETWCQSAAYEDVTLSLFGYASNGVRTTREDISSGTLLSGGTFTITVTDPKNVAHHVGATVGTDLVAAGNDVTLSLVSEDGAGTISKLSTGTYLVKAVGISNAGVNATYFTVTDSQTKPTLKVNKLYSTQPTVLAAINDCFDFNLNGSDIQVLVGDFDAVAVPGANQVFVKDVYVIQELDWAQTWAPFPTGTHYIIHKIDVNMTISYNN